MFQMNGKNDMNVANEIRAWESQMVEDRRFLHMNPELSNQEFETTAFIKKRLEEYGIEIENLPIPTGVSALIHGDRNGKTICIRHDIDALPIKEDTGLEFSSKQDGVSHCCGHDIHTVIALYCAKYLQEHRKQLKGNVRVVFQPAEETGAGARSMMRAGFAELAPQTDLVVGLHTHPMTTVGEICLRKGPMEAGVDYLKITVQGCSGHGAYPHDCVDPIVVSAYLITQLQTVISRENQAVCPAVLTLGSIHGGETYNSIPGEVTMLGTLRSLYPESREKNLDAIRRIVNHVCEGMRAKGTVEISEGNIPPIINRADVVDGIVKAADQVLGKGHVRELPNPSMGSDDFAVFLNQCEGAQFFLGTGNEQECSRLGLHKGNNIFDERSLVVGTAVLCQYIMNELGGHK